MANWSLRHVWKNDYLLGMTIEISHIPVPDLPQVCLRSLNAPRVLGRHRAARAGEDDDNIGDLVHVAARHVLVRK